MQRVNTAFDFHVFLNLDNILLVKSKYVWEPVNRRDRVFNPLPPPLTPTSLPLAPPPPRFPPPCPPPHFLPLGIFLPPPSKKKHVISSYNLSFQCMDYYQSLKTVGQFVCSSVHLLVCFGVLQPSQRPSRQHCNQVKQCPRRKGEVKGRQDRWERKMQAQKVPVLL